ncbi:MAG: ABC transporter substrate-binding protein [Caldilineaceae bacterium]
MAAGQGVIAHSSLMPDNWAYNPNVTQCPYDPEQARQLLTAAGWVDANGDGVREKDGVILQFLLYAPDEPFQSRLIERITADWAGNRCPCRCQRLSLCQHDERLLAPA